MSAHVSAPKTTLKTTYFMLFVKNVINNLEKKLVIKFFFDGIDEFYKYFFSACCNFSYWVKNAWLEKNLFMKSYLYFFLWKTLDYLYLLKIFIRNGFFR